MSSCLVSMFHLDLHPVSLTEEEWSDGRGAETGYTVIHGLTGGEQRRVTQ